MKLESFSSSKLIHVALVLIFVQDVHNIAHGIQPNNSFCFDHLKTFSSEIIMDRIDQESNTEFIDGASLKIRRDGEIRKIYGNFDIKLPLNNSFFARMRGFSKTGAG